MGHQKTPEILEKLESFQICFHGNNLGFWDITSTYWLQTDYIT